MVAISSKSKTNLTYAVSYGFAGGPLHSRKMDRLLQASGYVSVDAQEADIIIAHSAGCWFIPNSAQPKIVLYVGMPLAQDNPWQTWLTANVNHRRNGLLLNVQLWFKNMYYASLQPRRNIKIVRMGKRAQSVILPGVRAVFIANQHDPWPRADILGRYLDKHSWAFISLPGTHDDIWLHPERYTSIINHYARLLAQTDS